MKPKLAWFAALGVIAFFVVREASQVPLATALQFGGDEGYELMKGFLCSRGSRLYSEVWSDQPPLHTGVLSILFRAFGPSVLAARMAALGFSLLLLVTFYFAVRRRSGHGAALVAAALLALSPYYIQLTVSAMIVVPAMAMQMLAVLVFLAALERDRRWWLLLAGVCMGLALQAKFTTALVMPAVLVELLRRAGASSTGAGPSRAGVARLKRTAVESAVWGGGVLLGFGFMLALYPAQTAGLLWTPHFSAETRLAFESHGSLQMLHRMLWGDVGVVVAAAVGLFWTLATRRWELAFPAVWLLTTYVAHLIHRPFWYFHYIHLAVPLAWLAGVAVKELIVWVLRSDRAQWWKPPFKAAGVYVVWSVTVAQLLAETPGKWNAEWGRVRFAENAAENRVVRRMIAFDNRVNWVFTDRAIYAFHARLPVVPELAVLSRKRRRGGHVTDTQIVELLRRYQPELIVAHGFQQGVVAEYLAAHYRAEDTSPTFHVLLDPADAPGAGPETSP